MHVREFPGGDQLVVGCVSRPHHLVDQLFCVRCVVFAESVLDEYDEAVIALLRQVSILFKRFKMTCFELQLFFTVC